MANCYVRQFYMPRVEDSSPVRILDPINEHLQIKGLYPCGEGAGCRVIS
jgi:uncharacterized FAD-dependent dehydrogenase